MDPRMIEPLLVLTRAAKLICGLAVSVGVALVVSLPFIAFKNHESTQFFKTLAYYGVYLAGSAHYANVFLSGLGRNR